MLLDSGLDFFEEVRRLDLRKPPATAELLNWFQILADSGVPVTAKIREIPEVLTTSLPTLAKTKDDRDILTAWVRETFLKTT